MTRHERPELQPCPFCGGTRLTEKQSTRWGYFISCSCHAVGPSARSKESAAHAWNTRVEQFQTRLHLPATKLLHTKDGIVGHCTCSECGEKVHRRDLYCWHCGAGFEVACNGKV